MRFNHRSFTSLIAKMALFGLILASSSCGKFGTKNVPTTTAGSIGATGCLNNSTDLVTRYIAGQTSASEWKNAFDCVNNSLDFFSEYVHGTTKDTYSQGDMYNLVSKFLITNQPVHQGLVQGALGLKAALMGGTQSELTADQITLVKNSLNQLRDITSTLIPYLQIRQQSNPSYEQLNAMVAAFQTAGTQLSNFIRTLPTQDLSDDAITTLVNELTVSLNLPVVDGLTDTLFLTKWMLLNTRRDAVEMREWPDVFKTAMGLSGILLAYRTSVGTDPNDPRADVANRLENDYRFREFVWGLAQDFLPYLSDSITRHGGAIPFPLFDHLIDELPNGLINNIPKQVLKQSLRPIIRELMISGSQIGLDPSSVKTVYAVLGDLVADLGLLDRFYERTGLDPNSVQASDFATALNRYLASLSGNDQVRFAIIKQKLLTYNPLFYNGSFRVRFQNGIGYSKTQHFTVLMVDRLLRHLVKIYGSGADYFVSDDFASFFHEYQDLLFALQLVDPTLVDFGPKRLLEIDLFTQASDGNGQASIPEIVNYSMEVLSSNLMGLQVRNEITPSCDSGLGLDLMGWTKVPADCFRKQFNDRLSHWIDQFPRLQKFWSTLTPNQQAEDMMWLEHGARRDGFTNMDFDRYDMISMGTLLHFTETLFTRYDADSSEVITKNEVSNAYSLFKNLLAEKANMGATNDYVLKGVFTYIVKYRSMPQTSGFTNLAKLGWWLAIYDLPFTHYSADRSGVFNIVCQLAQPDIASQQALTPKICSQ